MANPYTQGNPYLTNVADGIGQQPNYQGQMQDTRMQDQFHNQALQQMSQMASGQGITGGMNPLALAQALRGLNNDKDRLATSGYGTQSGALANPSQWTYGADAAQTYNYGG